MLRLRQYKPCDADVIASWCRDERTLRKWSSDRFGDFPISGKEINEKYLDNNGDCPDEDNFYPFTAFDDGAVGHLILRFTDSEKKTVRFGFIIVDDTKRGMGCGKKMLLLAQKYAFEILGAERVTLGVFDSNPAAYHCYKAAGFKEVQEEEPERFEVFGEVWHVIELEMTRADYEEREAGKSSLAGTVSSEYEEISRRLDGLKAQGKIKTATFRQLMARKMQLSGTLALIKEYEKGDEQG